MQKKGPEIFRALGVGGPVSQLNSGPPLPHVFRIAPMSKDMRQKGPQRIARSTGASLNPSAQEHLVLKSPNRPEAVLLKWRSGRSTLLEPTNGKRRSRLELVWLTSGLGLKLSLHPLPRGNLLPPQACLGPPAYVDAHWIHHLVDGPGTRDQVSLVLNASFDPHQSCVVVPIAPAKQRTRKSRRDTFRSYRPADLVHQFLPHALASALCSAKALICRLQRISERVNRIRPQSSDQNSPQLTTSILSVRGQNRSALHKSL